MTKAKILLIVLPMLFLAQGCSLNPFGKSAGGGGVLKSQDSGESWQAANSLEDSGSLSGASIVRIRMDGEDQSVLYLASPTDGVFQTINAGQTWKKILSGARIYDLQVNPKNPAEIVAGGIENSRAKLFKSEDKGQTWIGVFSEAGSNNIVSAIAYDPTDPKNIYIGLSTGEIILSRNSGVSWDLLGRLTGRMLKIHVDPDTPRKLFILSAREGLYQSNDAGANWKLATANLKSGGQFQNFVALRSPKLLYVANASGLHKSADSGETWQSLDLPKNQSSSIVSAFTISPKDALVMYATVLQTLYKSTDGGLTWQTRVLATSASARDFLVHPKEPNNIYLALGGALQ